MEQRNFYQKSLTYEWKKLEDIRVLVPIVLKIVETIQPALTNTEPEPVEEPQKSEPEVASESLLPEPPVSQLMVENLQGFRGLLGSNDNVRVDSAVIDH